MQGPAPLYKNLGDIFDHDYPIKGLHRFFAKLPGVLRRLGSPHPYQLIVTTNYDDVLERAFHEEGEPYDLVTYIAKSTHRGKFRHTPHGEAIDFPGVLIESPNDYNGLPIMGKKLTERTIILKIHGAVDRALARKVDRGTCFAKELYDSFVITEDDYIKYIALTEFSNLLPTQLKAKVANSGFLFLGYGLSDWNLRVILHRIWSEQELGYASWAIQLQPTELDEKIWEQHKIKIVGAPLEQYIPRLYRKLLKAKKTGRRR